MNGNERATNDISSVHQKYTTFSLVVKYQLLPARIIAFYEGEGGATPPPHSVAGRGAVSAPGTCCHFQMQSPYRSLPRPGPNAGHASSTGAGGAAPPSTLIRTRPDRLFAGVSGLCPKLGIPGSTPPRCGGFAPSVIECSYHTGGKDHGAPRQQSGPTLRVAGRSDHHLEKSGPACRADCQSAPRPPGY